MAGDAGGQRQRGDDEPRVGAAGTPAQKKSLIAAERDETQRAAWVEQISALEPASLVFLDETSTQTVLTRARARARRGERAVAALPRNHGPNVTCLAAFSGAGILAPLVFDGALDGRIFAQWTRQWLVPQLRPGQLVVLDNLSVHKNKAARAAVEAAGCRLCFLPVYSPDFNPIELAWAKLKTHLRGVGARDGPALIDAIGDGLSAVTPADARAFFRHCGYREPPASTMQPL